ncbi:DinB family protein [Nocardia sp. 348MFTsu5.1]|uniref:DinB family protein n=1 Tax=Nocardia sp. 348MFTsu5.1 TaxID=1172185 RepID=UPI0003A3A5E2|nr:DinB family protein [Nocardia sp. 348MFTsu5.1]
MAGTYTAVVLSVPVTGEKADILTLLADQRAMLKVTARNLTDAQARTRTTVSELTIGGLIKHLAQGERGNAKTISERDEDAEFDMSEVADAYLLRDDETLGYWLDEYDRAAADYDRVIAEVASLDELIPQPTAPWQPEREWWSVRKMALHLLRETAHHCGHADIIREALDGQSTMAAISEGSDWADGAAE